MIAYFAIVLNLGEAGQMISGTLSHSWSWPNPHSELFKYAIRFKYRRPHTCLQLYCTALVLENMFKTSPSCSDDSARTYGIRSALTMLFAASWVISQMLADSLFDRYHQFCFNSLAPQILDFLQKKYACLRFGKFDVSTWHLRQRCHSSQVAYRKCSHLIEETIPVTQHHDLYANVYPLIAAETAWIEHTTIISWSLCMSQLMYWKTYRYASSDLVWSWIKKSWILELRQTTGHWTNTCLQFTAVDGYGHVLLNNICHWIEMFKLHLILAVMRHNWSLDYLYVIHSEHHLVCSVNQGISLNTVVVPL